MKQGVISVARTEESGVQIERIGYIAVFVAAHPMDALLVLTKHGELLLSLKQADQAVNAIPIGGAVNRMLNPITKASPAQFAPDLGINATDVGIGVAVLF